MILSHRTNGFIFKGILGECEWVGGKSEKDSKHHRFTPDAGQLNRMGLRDHQQHCSDRHFIELHLDYLDGEFNNNTHSLTHTHKHSTKINYGWFDETMRRFWIFCNKWILITRIEPNRTKTNRYRCYRNRINGQQHMCAWVQIGKSVDNFQNSLVKCSVESELIYGKWVYFSLNPPPLPHAHIHTVIVIRCWCNMMALEL